jgi:DNA mismatch repair ATPase MutS
LAQSPAVIIVASHDTELGQMLEGPYRLHHFAESFKENRMEFDYQLKDGVCGIGNAIRTLEYVGFPATVIAEAGEHVARIQATGGIYRTPAGATSEANESPA